MRKIKFRAWDKQDEKILSHNTLRDTSVCFDRGFYQMIDSGRYLFMQYTGLRAKNGDIYEGDILKYADLPGDEWLMNKTKTTGRVVWIDYRCAFFPQEIEENHKGGNYISYWDQIDDIEIIGNIHENPELCKAVIQ